MTHYGEIHWTSKSRVVFICLFPNWNGPEIHNKQLLIVLLWHQSVDKIKEKTDHCRRIIQNIKIVNAEKNVS